MIYKKQIRAFFTSHMPWRKVLLHSAFALTFTAGLSYLVGFVRDRLLAQTFGASATLDVYYAAFVIPDFILALFVTSSVGAAFVPLFVESLKKSQSAARDYMYNIIAWLSVIVIVCAILAAIFVPFVAHLLVPGFDDAGRKLYITAVRIMLLSPIIFALSNIFGGVLLSVRDFFFYGIAPVFYNIGIIVGALFFVPHLGMTGLMWGTVFGAVLHLVSRIGITIARTGLPRRLPLYWDHMTTQTAQLMLPKIMQIGAWQLLLAWFIHIASTMSEGSVTAYSLARNFQSMPVSLVGIALALSTFATLSHLRAQKSFKTFHRVLQQKLLLVGVLTTLIAIVLALISKPFIALLLGGGAFDAAAVSLTATTLTIYAISIPFESVMHMLSRAHYALKKTFAPSVIHVVTIAATILMSWQFYGQYGVIVIPLSFAIGLVLQDILLLISYQRLIRTQTVMEHHS